MAAFKIIQQKQDSVKQKKNQIKQKTKIINGHNLYIVKILKRNICIILVQRTSVSMSSLT